MKITIKPNTLQLKKYEVFGIKYNSKILIISSNEKTCSKIKYCYIIHNYTASNYLLKFVKANIREVAKTALIIAYRCIYGFPFVFLYVSKLLAMYNAVSKTFFWHFQHF